MLKHWTYRTLNLEGRITITKSLALLKLTHLATVLPELDNQKAKKMEDLTIKFIWRTFKATWLHLLDRLTRATYRWRRCTRVVPGACGAVSAVRCLRCGAERHAGAPHGGHVLGE